MSLDLRRIYICICGRLLQFDVCGVWAVSILREGKECEAKRKGSVWWVGCGVCEIRIDGTLRMGWGMGWGVVVECSIMSVSLRAMTAMRDVVMRGVCMYMFCWRCDDGDARVVIRCCTCSGDSDVRLLRRKAIAGGGLLCGRRCRCGWSRGG